MVNTVKYSQFPTGGAIQSGDTLVGLRNGVNTRFDASTVSGGGSTLTVTTGSPHGFSVWDVLYLNGSTYTKADSTSDVTAEAIGIVVDVPTTTSFVIQQTGHISNAATPSYGTFSSGVVYFLSNSAGALTSTPTTTTGQVVKPMFVATGATSGWIFPYRGEILGASGSGGGGGGSAPSNATYITQTPDSSLSNEQALSLLTTGLMKSTTATGVVSIATNGTDYYGPGLGAPIPVSEGGTGQPLFTPYTVICAGTTPAGALQNIASVGNAGQILTSNGPGLLPTFQANPSSGFAKIATITVAAASSLDISNYFTSTYDSYEIWFNVVLNTVSAFLRGYVGYGGTPTFDTGFNYWWNVDGGYSGSNGPDNAIRMLGLEGAGQAQNNTDANFGIVGKILVSAFSGGTPRPGLSWFANNLSALGQYNGGQGHARYLGANPMTSFRLAPNGGTITGTATIYGVSK